MRYQERLNSQQQIDRRLHKEYEVPTVEMFDGKYYLIANDIFDLSNNGQAIGTDIISQFPVILCYLGDQLHFEDNECEAFKLLIKIIYNFNRLQDSKFHSFPLGKLIAKLIPTDYYPIFHYSCLFGSP